MRMTIGDVCNLAAREENETAIDLARQSGWADDKITRSLLSVARTDSRDPLNAHLARVATKNASVPFLIIEALAYGTTDKFLAGALESKNRFTWHNPVTPRYHVVVHGEAVVVLQLAAGKRPIAMTYHESAFEYVICWGLTGVIARCAADPSYRCPEKFSRRARAQSRNFAIAHVEPFNKIQDKWHVDVANFYDHPYLHVELSSKESAWCATYSKEFDPEEDHRRVARQYAEKTVRYVEKPSVFNFLARRRHNVRRN